MLQVNISFPSGSGENLQLPEHSKVGDLKILAQKSLRQGFLKLITAEGHVLTNPEISLQAAGVQEGEHLTVVAQQTKVAHTGQAFALWCSGGNQVVAWGNPEGGGDCAVVEGVLWNVQEIQATDKAFAAILTDGSVISWGSPDDGGDCSVVQDQLSNVRQIQATECACSDIGWWIRGFIVLLRGPSPRHPQKAFFLEKHD